MTTLSIPAAVASDAGVVGRSVRFIGRGLGMVVLLALLLIAGASIAVPAIAGATPLAVLTSSMEPTYPPGTLVVVRPADPEEIRVGDVITFQLNSGEPAVVTHRVTEVAVDSAGEHVFRTQGDNNPRPDAKPVREVQLKGELLYAVPGLGWVQNALTGETRAVMIPLVAGGLFAYAGVSIIAAMIAARRRGRVTASHRGLAAHREEQST